MPVVVYQGFSIHGNEPSGANAGLALAYYLAAAEGPKMEELLQKYHHPFFDPSFNPDGLQRFSTLGQYAQKRTHQSRIPTTENTMRSGLEEGPITIGSISTATGSCPIAGEQGTYRNVSPVVPKHPNGPPWDGNQFHVFLSTRNPSRTHPLTPKKTRSLPLRSEHSMRQLLIIWEASTTPKRTMTIFTTERVLRSRTLMVASEFLNKPPQEAMHKTATMGCLLFHLPFAISLLQVFPPFLKLPWPSKMPYWITNGLLQKMRAWKLPKTAALSFLGMKRRCQNLPSGWNLKRHHSIIRT